MVPLESYKYRLMISDNFCMCYNIEIVTCPIDQAGPKLVIFPELIGVRYHAWIVF